MDPVERGNLLSDPREKALEYAVHGKWRRNGNDTKGVDGTWYIGVPELVDTFGAAAVRSKLTEYELAQEEARERAIVDAEAAAAERAAEGGGGARGGEETG